MEIGKEAQSWYDFKPGEKITIEPYIACVNVNIPAVSTITIIAAMEGFTVSAWPVTHLHTCMAVTVNFFISSKVLISISKIKILV